MAQKAHDLCLASDVAAELGVASSAAIERAVSAVSRLIANHCGRTFERATVTENVRSPGRHRILLARPPVISVTSITDHGSELDADTYEVESSEQGMILHLTGSFRRTDRSGGNITLAPDTGPGVAQSDDNGLQVVYVGGYVTPGQNALDSGTYGTVTVPEDLQEAAIMAAVNLRKRVGLDQNLASESLGDWSVSYRGELPQLLGAELAAVLDHYTLRRAV